MFQGQFFSSSFFPPSYFPELGSSQHGHGGTKGGRKFYSQVLALMMRQEMENREQYSVLGQEIKNRKFNAQQALLKMMEEAEVKRLNDVWRNGIYGVILSEL